MKVKMIMNVHENLLEREINDFIRHKKIIDIIAARHDRLSTILIMYEDLRKSTNWIEERRLSYELNCADIVYKCPECGNYEKVKSKYCPHCGSKMEEK